MRIKCVRNYLAKQTGVLAGALALLGTLTALPAQATVQIQHWTTSRGANVYYVENHDLPMLDLSVQFAAGSARDPAGLEGLAGMTADMLPLGAAGIHEDAIARGFASLGAIQGGQIDQDRAELSLRTLSDAAHADPAIALFTKLYTRPDFPASVLEREKQRALVGLRDAMTRPEYQADLAFAKALYPNHPYGREGSGTLESLPRITRNDLVSFWKSHYVAANMTISIIGDVSNSQAHQLAESLSDGLPRGVAQPPLPQPAPAKAQVIEISNPASQSHILMGQVGVARNDPDYFALYLGNYVLGGGGFSSRLLNQVREKRGLAYSVTSYFLPAQAAGPWQISLQTKASQADEAVKIVRQVVNEFVQDGPTQKEIDDAKSHIVNGFALRFDSNSKILAYVDVIGFYHLPLTWLEDFPKGIEKVTLAQVKDAFRRRVHPDQLVLVETRPETPGGH